MEQAGLQNGSGRRASHAAALADLGFLSRLLDETDDGTELVGADGTLRFVNRAGANGMYGGDAAAAEGRDWVSLWPEGSRAAAAEALGKAKEGRATRFTAARGEDAGATWWDVSLTPMDGNGDDRTALVISRDITQLVAQAERLEIVGAEMRHRLRNAFTIATSLTMIAARQAPQHRKFADRLIEAFRHYVAVQELVLNPRGSKSLHDLLPMVTKAFGDAALFDYSELPRIVLPDGAIQVLALTFGELCTNSLKHGGLRDGRPVKLSGSNDDDSVELVWEEATRFGSPRQGGQGLALMDRMVGVVGGSVTREVGADKLVCRIRLPKSA
jgi:PAS domain S-box-containing protein